MILKNVKYGNVEGVTVCEFGNGTMSLVPASNKEGYEAILMKSHEKREIGEVGAELENSDIYKPEIALVFWNEESFEVFEDMVKEVRKQFDARKAPSLK